MGRSSKKSKPEEQHDAPRSTPSSGSIRSTFALAAAGAVLYWAALPPMNWWPLAWVAPVPWLLLIRREVLPGRRPYAAMGCVALVFWLVSLYWITFPHPATSAGWIAISVYLCVYLPLFVGLSRVAVHRLRLPLVAAAPTVWMGLELVRGHMFTGFTFAAIEHTQLACLPLLQIADLGGQYVVGGVMLLASAALASLVPIDGRWSWKPLPIAVVALAATVGYGLHRMRPVDEEATPAARIALIQGSIDVSIPTSEDQYYATVDDTFEQYIGLTIEAAERGPLDLIAWPETVWPYPVYDLRGETEPPAGWPDQMPPFEQYVEAEARGRELIAELAQRVDTPLLLGVGTQRPTPDGEERLNSALLTTRDGTFVDSYHKMQRVLFGEYVPILGDYPEYNFLKTICQQTTAGDTPKRFEVGRTSVSPNICYESVLPHLIRGHVKTLAAAGEEPDVLINLTNDGWFRGSSELDMHLACGVFRAIEMRKPMLIAANTGFSAHIDGDGRILQKGPRRATAVLIAEVVPDGRKSLYLRWGDWPAGLCLLACLVFACIGIRDRWSNHGGEA